MRQKTGGRQKNTPNKLTSELKNIIKQIVSNQLDKLDAELETLTPEKRIDFTIKLMQFILPKTTNLNIGEETEKIEVVFIEGKTIL